MNKKIYIVLAAGSLLLLLIVWYFLMLSSRIPKNQEMAIVSFYAREVAEDQIMDPLILAGASVVPLLIKEVENPNMKNRRYAITALGNIGAKTAIPILETLVRKKSEEDYIRCDALSAIGMIDESEGARIAGDIKNENIFCISEIKNTQNHSQWLKSNTWKRTYFEALLGRHY